MANDWIVVANSTQAQIFTPAPPAPRLKDPEPVQFSTEGLPPARLVEMETLEHPQGRIIPGDRCRPSGANISNCR